MLSGFFREKIDSSQIQEIVREMVVESERKYQTLVENSVVGILIYADDHIVFANPRFKEMLGYEEEEYKTMKIWDFIHPELRDMVKERAYQRISGQNPPAQYEICMVKKDGQPIDVLLKSVRINYEGRPSLLVYIVDLSQQKKAQREIKELSTIVESALIPIIKIDSQGKILYFNKSTEKLLKIELKLMKGQPLSKLISGIDPTEIQDHIINKTKKGGFDSEILCRRADGEPFRMRLTTCPLVDEKEQMIAIACFLIDPAFQQSEKNLLNAQDEHAPGLKTFPEPSSF